MEDIAELIAELKVLANTLKLKLSKIERTINELEGVIQTNMKTMKETNTKRNSIWKKFYS